MCAFPAKGPSFEDGFAAGARNIAPKPGVAAAPLAEARPSAASGSDVGTRSQPALSQLGAPVPPLPPLPLCSMTGFRGWIG